MSTKIVINKCKTPDEPMLSDEACALYESLTGQPITNQIGSVPRHDPALVSVVEQLGDKANDCGIDWSDLAVVEIAGDTYRIDERGDHLDGATEEFVVEPSDLVWISAR